MAKFPNLAIRGTKYYFRRKVPAHLVEVIGQKEWVKSLGNVSLDEANRLLVIERLNTNKLLQEAALVYDGEPSDAKKRSKPFRKPLSDDVAKKLVVLWLDERKAKISAAYYADANLFKSNKAKRKALAKVNVQLKKFNRGTAKSVTSYLVKQSNKLLKKYKYVSLKNTASPRASHYRVLLDELRRAECIALNYKGGLLGDDAMHDMAARELDRSKASTIKEDIVKAKQAPTLKDLIEFHRLAHAEKGKSASSVKKWEVIYTILTDLWGRDKPLKAITRADCRDELKQFFLDCPVNAKKTYPKLNYKQIWERANEDSYPRMSPKTINDKLAYVSTLFKFGCNEDLMDKNPANNLAVAKGEVSASRVPFEQDELKKLLDTSLFDKEKRSHYFILLLALYQGMRSNEICQLLVGDMRKEAGLWVVEISKHSAAGKSVKTDASSRVLPLHSKVIEAGLVDFVNASDQKEGLRLFPDVTADKEGSYSNNFRGWFKRHQNNAGVTTEKKSMHSFRHTFETAAINGGIDLLTVKLLMGHKIGAGITDTYYHGKGLEKLQEAIEKVDYNLELSIGS